MVMQEPLSVRLGIQWIDSVRASALSLISSQRRPPQSEADRARLISAGVTARRDQEGLVRRAPFLSLVVAVLVMCVLGLALFPEIWPDLWPT